MILPSVFLPTRANQTWDQSGIDSPVHCKDKAWWSAYPHKIEYCYNSRGFRDAEWPNNLDDVIWCLGDSFTVGIGCPGEHTWPAVLQKATSRRAINIGLDGASNTWISNTAHDIACALAPKNMVIMWSFVERTELDLSTAQNNIWNRAYSDNREPGWPEHVSWTEFQSLPVHVRQKLSVVDLHPAIKISKDLSLVEFGLLHDERRNQILGNDEINSARFQQCYQSINFNSTTNVVNLFVPGWSDINARSIYLEHCRGTKFIDEFPLLDWGRDRYHFDILTATSLVDKIIPLLI